MTRYEVCQHEAGHAVVAWMHGLDVLTLSVHPDGESGLCEIIEPDPRTASDHEMRGNLLCLLAGPCVDPGLQHSSDDLQQAGDWYKLWTRRQSEPCPAFESVVTDLMCETRLLLGEHADRVSRLADELLERGRLNRKDIERILGNPTSRQTARPAARQMPRRPLSKWCTGTPGEPKHLDRDVAASKRVWFDWEYVPLCEACARDCA